MLKNLRSILCFAAVLVLVTGKNSHAQADYVPPLSGSPLAQWQIQGEYFGAVTGGGDLGAWLVSNGDNSYTVVFLPGGLLTLPGQPYGGWVRTGWTRSTYGGTATLTGTTFNATTSSLYKATSITGTGEARTMTGTTPNGAAFTLNRVMRNSPTHLLKPKPEWGPVDRLFDSATGSADLAKWRAVENSVSLSRGQLLRGVRSVAGLMGGFLHIEFQGCFNPKATGQGRSNSGVYLQGNYEAQVLDSFGSGGALDEFGAIYSVKAPTVNAALPPLTWHTYDIYFTPRTSGAPGDQVGAAAMTVYANGVLVQDSVPIKGATTAPQGGSLLLPGGIYLQNHTNDVVYTNIWFIPNATVKSFPYQTVLPTVGIKDNSIKPLLDNKSVGTEVILGTFDLSGRKIEKLKVKGTPKILLIK